MLAAASALAACGGGDDGGGSAPPILVDQCAVDADCLVVIEDTQFDPLCTVATCVDRQCRFSAGDRDDTPCDDGNPCTTGDLCGNRVCRGDKVVCDDGDDCTENTCDPATGECVYPVAVGAPCSDELPCTNQDRCNEEGVCRGKPTDGCECLGDEDCEDLGVTDRCLGPFVCLDDWTCGLDPDNFVVCDPSLDTTCATQTCDPVTGLCKPVSRNEGEPCGPADDPCVAEGTCAAGACQGTAVDCDDGDPCTTDSCDPEAGGCVHTPYTGPCNDGNGCTLNDTCKPDGTCAGVAKDCDDGSPCTNDLCVAATGQCVHPALEGDCDDQDACTFDDTCVGGACVGTAFLCFDGNDCTADVCTDVGGTPACSFEPIEGPCSLGDPCSTDDVCAAGQCVAGVILCECDVDADCAALEDGNPCTGTLVCNDSVLPTQCETDPATVPDCAAPPGSCLVGVCDPATGACGTSPGPDGAPCDDGDACTTGGTCTAGLCVATPKLCDDGDPCTADLCVAGTCTPTLLSNGELFVDEGFGGGLPAAWTATTTLPAVAWAGSTVYATDPGGGGALLTGPGGLYAGPVEAVLATPPLVVFGQDIKLGFAVLADLTESGCATDRLRVEVLAYGTKTVVRQICASLTSWTPFEVDLSPYRGQKIQIRFVFNANATQNTGFGVALDDVSVVGSFVCNDKDACTSDDRCVGGACVGDAKSCDDGDNCTLDSCNPVSGDCSFTQLTSCFCEVSADCPDKGPCVTETCGTDGVCVNTPVAGLCDDGSVCTTGDLCSGGKCVGTPVVCDDGNDCTQDVCDPVNGCLAPALDGVPCDDGDPCTEDDTCAVGTCVGTPKDCTTDNACLESACVLGDCISEAVWDGQVLAEHDFDAALAGALPDGWSSASDVAGWTWQASAAAAASAPQALALTWAGGATFGAANVTATAPPVALPPGGATGSYRISAVLPDDTCGADAVEVRCGETMLDLICSSTGTFEERPLDLSPCSGDAVSLQFLTRVGGGNAGELVVRIDDLQVLASRPCDDGDPCTGQDACAPLPPGTCAGTPIPGCP